MGGGVEEIVFYVVRFMACDYSLASSNYFHNYNILQEIWDHSNAGCSLRGCDPMNVLIGLLLKVEQNTRNPSHNPPN